jgi:hypothetical protein
MIGGPLRARQKNRHKMMELYKLRNKGTHGSSLSSMDQQKQDNALTEAGALYRKLLDSFWRHGARPDWNGSNSGRSPRSKGAANEPMPIERGVRVVAD